MHIITDLKKKLLSVKFTSVDVNKREVVIPMSKEIVGLLIGDAGYVSKKLSKRILSGA